MFNKKFVNVLSYIVGVIFVLQLVGGIVFFILSKVQTLNLHPMFFEVMTQIFQASNILLLFVILAGVRSLALTAPEKPKKKGLFKKE